MKVKGSVDGTCIIRLRLPSREDAGCALLVPLGSDCTCRALRRLATRRDAPILIKTRLLGVSHHRVPSRAAFTGSGASISGARRETQPAISLKPFGKDTGRSRANIKFDYRHAGELEGYGRLRPGVTRGVSFGHPMSVSVRIRAYGKAARLLRLLHGAQSGQHGGAYHRRLRAHPKPPKCCRFAAGSLSRPTACGLLSRC